MRTILRQSVESMKKFKGGGQLPPKASVREILIGLFGGTLGIAGLYGLTLITEYPILLAPFGASCVLLFAAPKAPLAQPRNVMGGYLVSTFVGLVFAWAFGSHPVSVSVGVGVAIALMQIVRMVHPPGGAATLVIILADGPLTQPFQTMVSIFIGSVFLLLLALFLNGIGREGKWPHYWWGKHH